MEKLHLDNKYNRNVVVVGGGFAGINFIRKLKNAPVDVVLIDQNNYHTFQPLLYQVAIMGLEPQSVASPLRRMFDKYENYRSILN